MIKLTLDPDIDEGCPSFCGPSCAQYRCCSHHIEDCDFVDPDEESTDSSYDAYVNEVLYDICEYVNQVL